MVRMNRFVLLALVAALLLVACDSSAEPTPAGPGAPATANDAEGVARAFLDGWVNGNYGAMYAVLSAKSLTIDPDSFAKTYKDAEATLKLAENGKSYVLHGDLTERQGTTVAVHYDMTFDSGAVGKFTDADRTMRLILSNGKWRVAWSTMDIFEGIAGGAKLEVQYIQSKRGTIFDRNGLVIAQDGVHNWAIRFLPGKYPTGKSIDCYRVLADIFRLRVEDLAAAYDQFTPAQYGNFGFTVGTLDDSDYQKLKPQLDSVCGVQSVPQTTRFYYSGSFAAQAVGYLSQIQPEDLGTYPQYAHDALIGRGGVEGAYESQLAGDPGARLVITAPDGVLVRAIHSKEPSASQDVTLTLDRDVQVNTENAIASAYSDANWAHFSTGAAAVVLNANTGEVLAMASYPTISPDVFLPSTTFDTAPTLALYNKQRATFNRATQETYAAGSVFKIVSTGAAAGSGAYKMTDTYTCTGIWDGSAIGDRIRKDWIYLDPYAPKPYHDTLTLQQGLTASCDTYFWTVGAKLDGIDATLLRKYGNQMGLGVKTGIDTLPEEAGNIPDPDWKSKAFGKAWGIGDSLNIVIGQGDVKVTAIQVARMIMGIANGGKLYQPQLVKSVGAANQAPTYIATPAPMTNTNLPTPVLKGIQDGLCAVVTDTKIGTANFVFYNWDSSKIVVCGKTGTAQTGSPYPNGWFTAYAGKPGQPPDIAIAVIVERSREGSETAGPIVRRIIESYYNLPQEPWPDFWSGTYQQMPDPNASDGGPVRTKKK